LERSSFQGENGNKGKKVAAAKVDLVKEMARMVDYADNLLTSLPKNNDRTLDGLNG